MICSLCHKKIIVETDEFEETAPCEFGHVRCVDEQEERVKPHYDVNDFKKREKSAQVSERTP